MGRGARVVVGGDQPQGAGYFFTPTVLADVPTSAQMGHTEIYRGAEYKVDLIPKVKVEVLTDEESAPRIAEAIAVAARTFWIRVIGSLLIAGVRSRCPA